MNLSASMYIGGILSSDCLTTTNATPHITAVDKSATGAAILKNFSFFITILFYHIGGFFASKKTEAPFSRRAALPSLQIAFFVVVYDLMKVRQPAGLPPSDITVMPFALQVFSLLKMQSAVQETMVSTL